MRLAGLSLAGLVLPPARLPADPPPEQLGRVAEAKAVVYSRPAVEASEVKTYWKDMVLPITEVTVGDEVRVGVDECTGNNRVKDGSGARVVVTVGLTV